MLNLAALTPLKEGIVNFTHPCSKSETDIMLEDVSFGVPCRTNDGWLNSQPSEVADECR